MRSQTKLTSIEQYIRQLIAAGIAAIAAFVHAILSPIFKAAFGKNNQITLYQEFIKCVLLTGLMRWVGHTVNQRIEVINVMNWGGISFISINFIKSLFYYGPQYLDFISLLYGGDTLRFIRIAHRLGVDSRELISLLNDIIHRPYDGRKDFLIISILLVDHLSIESYNQLSINLLSQ